MKIFQGTSLTPGFSLQPGLIDPVNYAADPAVVERARQLFKKKEQIEAQRAPLERDWIEYYKIWACEKHGDQSQAHKGLHEVYLPDTYILTETEVDHLKEAIFPFTNNIAIRPWASDPMAPMMVLPVLELMQYDINQADIKSNIDVTLRSSIIYGWAPVKVVWQVETCTDYARALVEDPFSQQASQIGFGSREVIKFEGPTFHPVHPFNLYVYPFNQSDPKKLTWVHENMTIGWDFLLSMQAEGTYLGIEALLESRGKPSTTRSDNNRDELLQRLGVTEGQVEDPDSFKATEIYTKWDLYGTGQLVPTKITYSGDVILEIRQDPHNDQEPPYVYHRDAKVSETFYGRSRIKAVKALQYTNNAVVNQGLDSNAFASSNMVVVDVTRLRGRVEDIEITPLMVFQMTGDASDKAIRFVAPPNTIQQNIMLSQQISTGMRDSFRIPTGMQGKATGNTATEIATTTQAGLVGVGAVANNFENDLMSKWLTKAYKREQQFRGIDSPPRLGMPIVPAEALVPEYSMQFLSGKAAQEYMMQMQEAMMQAEAGQEGAPFGGDHPNGTPKNNTPAPEEGGAA